MALQLSQTGHVVEDLIERGLSQVLSSAHIDFFRVVLNYDSEFAAIMRGIIQSR